LNIPDNAPAGVRDTVNFAAAATLASIKVTVDITHTYIGDLRLTLLAPSGAAAVLHDRNGGNADNIQRVFDLASTPALGALSGQSIQGTWTLHVQDFAAVDVGRLNRWELEIQGSQTAVVNLEESPGAQIPDNNPTGIERTLTTAEIGRVSEIEASVDITHTFIGDLEVTLLSPTGTGVPLHSRGGGSADNLIKTYESSTTSGLRALRGQPVQGAWKLKIADREAADVGKLNRWALKIALQS
jgi:subtilisin-like proprotein convertase family protein